jgi:hypothetical protein
MRHLGVPDVIAELDDRLLEEAVLAAICGRSEERAFHLERERIYTVQDPEERERRFAALYRDWFLRLGLEASVRGALEERPEIAASVEHCALVKASWAADEGAELFVAPPQAASAGKARRRLQIRLLPQSLLQPDLLLPFLRAELLHIADMLDPSFGYRPSLPVSQAGPTHDRLLMDRYSALWSASVWGRVAARCASGPEVRERCLRRFLAVFPMFAADPEPVFARFFDGPRPCHDEIVRVALDPRGSSSLGAGRDRGSKCQLCGFPTYAFEPEAALDAPLVAGVRQDFPRWQAHDGLCPQCAALYRARSRLTAQTCGPRPRVDLEEIGS